MTKAGEKIIEGAKDALLMAQRSASYTQDKAIGLFYAALPGAAFYLPPEILADLDWQRAITAVRDNEHADGVSLTFVGGGVHVRMKGGENP